MLILLVLLLLPQCGYTVGIWAMVPPRTVFSVDNKQEEDTKEPNEEEVSEDTREDTDSVFSPLLLTSADALTNETAGSLVDYTNYNRVELY